MTALKHIYSAGRWIAGASILAGILADTVGEPFGAGLPSAVISRWCMLTGLLTLGFTPIFGLAMAGLSWLRTKPGDTVGWVALIFAGVLGMLWWLE